jgi:gas vesicle protein GvpK
MTKAKPRRPGALPGHRAKTRSNAPRRRAKTPVAPNASREPEAEVDSLRKELQRAASGLRGARWNASPDDVQRSVMQLVLTLVELIRRLLERQAIRRLEARTLTKKETENVGLALMRLEETIHDLADQFGLQPEDLNLDLGPIGKLM